MEFYGLGLPLVEHTEDTGIVKNMMVEAVINNIKLETILMELSNLVNNMNLNTSSVHKINHCVSNELLRNVLFDQTIMVVTQ